MNRFRRWTKVLMIATAVSCLALLARPAHAGTVVTTTAPADGGADFFAFDNGAVQINNASGSAVVGSLPNGQVGVRSFFDFAYDVSSTIGSGEMFDNALFSLYFRNPDGGPTGPVSLLYRSSAPADNNDLYDLTAYTDTGVDLDVSNNNTPLTVDITTAFAEELANSNDGRFLLMARADDEGIFSTNNQQAYFFATNEFSPSPAQTAGGYTIPTLTINSSVVAVPEPATASIIPVAFGWMAYRKRRRARKPQH